MLEWRLMLSSRPALSSPVYGCIAFSLALCLALPSGRAADLVLAFVSDVHGHIESKPNRSGGAARLATVVQDLRRRANRTRSTFLLVHAGDLYQGTPLVNQSRGGSARSFLQALKFHFGVPGNHEWDYGWGSYESLRALPRPLLYGTNLAGDPKLKKSLVLDVDGVPVAFLGYTLPATKEKAPPGSTRSLEFLGPESLAKEMAALRTRGVERFVLLSHTNRKEVEGIGVRLGFDLVIGAHTNEVFAPTQIGPTTVYMQAGHHLEHVGQARLQTKDPGAPLFVTGEVLPLSPEIPRDPGVVRLVAKMLEPLRKEMNRPLTVLPSPIRKGSWSLHSDLVAGAAHALRESAGADLAFLNPQACRLPKIGPGEIRVETAYQAFPYQNRIACIPLTGAQLDALYENLVSKQFLPRTQGSKSWLVSQDSRGILQPSGFDVEVDPSQPAGERIRLFLPSGEPLPPNKVFQVATSDYLAQGGDNYAGLPAEGTRFLEATVTGAVQARLEAKGPAFAKASGELRNRSLRLGGETPQIRRPSPGI